MIKKEEQPKGQSGFDIFFSSFQRKKEQDLQKARENDRLTQYKKEILKPFIEFLHLAKESGVIVQDAQAGMGGKPLSAEQRFQFYIAPPTLPTYAGGISLFIDHPLSLEIAVPLNHQISKYGAVVFLTSDNRYPEFSSNRVYQRIDEALSVLADFLGKVTLRLEGSLDGATDHLEVNQLDLDLGSAESDKVASFKRLTPANYDLDKAYEKALRRAPDAESGSGPDYHIRWIPVPSEGAGVVRKRLKEMVPFKTKYLPYAIADLSFAEKESDE